MKFGIGLQLVKISKEEFIKIIDKFYENIEYIYYSSLDDYKFYGRKILKPSELKKFNSINPKDQYEILEYARNKYGIKTELCVNSYRCNSEEDFIAMFKNEISKHKPDKCVTFNKLVDKLYKIEPNIKYELSFNEGLFSQEDVNKISKNFSSVVIGGRFIRDDKMMKKLKSKGFIPNILVNNSCAHNCNYCGKTDCLKVFNNNLKTSLNDINIPFAIQTLFPFELIENRDIYSDDNFYKLSTRLCDYEELFFLLETFINNLNDFVNYSHFHAICPLRHFEKYYEDINVKEVVRLKKAIWKKLKTSV